MAVGKALDEQESRERKIELDRIAAMLSRLGGRGYRVKGDSAPYRVAETDFDPDSDFDPDEIKSQQADALEAHSSRQ